MSNLVYLSVALDVTVRS